MRKFLLFLIILSLFTNILTTESEEEDEEVADDATPQGKSFFLFGGIIHRFRRRWFGYREPLGGPAFAGPAFPLSGYYNCPIYGCNPALAYQPAPFEPPNFYNYPVPPPPNAYALSPQQQFLQQQQQQQQYQQNNLHNYQHGPPPAPLPMPLYPYRVAPGSLPIGNPNYPPYPVHGNYPPPPGFPPFVNPALNGALLLGPPSLPPMGSLPGPPIAPASIQGSCNSQMQPCGG